MIFVVPVKFDPENPVVFDCVDSIRKHEPEARIAVMNTSGDYHCYKQGLGEIDLLGQIQQPYPMASYRWAYEQTTDETWAFIHDSLILHGPIPEPEPLLTVRYFEAPATGWGWDAEGRSLEDWAHEVAPFPIPKVFTGILGPMWFCKSDVMDALIGHGVFDIKVENKYQLCAMERIVGIALTQCGYDPRQSLQGEMAGFFDQYDETIVQKLHPGRP